MQYTEKFVNALTNNGLRHQESPIMIITRKLERILYEQGKLEV